MAEYSFECFHCKAEIRQAHLPGRGEECPKCHTDLHVCKNCQHYDRSAYNECREPAADIVKDKERSNFCDHFFPSSQRQAQSSADALRAAAEALFKKKAD